MPGFMQIPELRECYEDAKTEKRAMMFENAKPGDEVLLNNATIEHIARVNKKSIVIGGYNRRFSRITGRELMVDRFWAPAADFSIEPLTPALLQALRKKERRNVLITLGVNRLHAIADNDRLAQIVEGIVE